MFTNFYPLTQCTILALLLSDACRPLISSFVVKLLLSFIHMWERSRNCARLPHSWLVNLIQLANHQSFYTDIVSIDTTRHLTPTGLHNLVFLPGTQVHTYTEQYTHTHTHTHSLPSHSLSDLASGRAGSVMVLEIVVSSSPEYCSDIIRVLFTLNYLISCSNPCWLNYIEFL